MLPPLNGWQHPTVHLLPKAGCEMGPQHHLHWHFLTVNKAGTPDVYVLFVFSSMKCLFLAFDLTSFQINFLKNLIFKNCIYLFWLSHTACWIKPKPPALDMQSLNHCTTGEAPLWPSFYCVVFFFFQSSKYSFYVLDTSPLYALSLYISAFDEMNVLVST